MGSVKKIGVLTSGGDAPGMNAAVRAVYLAGKFNGVEVMGVKRGYNGLLNNDIFEITKNDVMDVMQRGGTFLQTARCLEFKQPENVQMAVKNAREMGIEGLVVVGGDGSFRGARDLSLAGLPTIGIPGTIDNDIVCTDYCIGFDTALNTVIDAVDKIEDTTASHDRCSVIEVMGKDAGYIAINVGIACCADVVVIPERKFSYQEDIIKPILEAKNNEKNHFIVILAEGVGGAMQMAKEIEDATGIESRATILGHIQRGGSPSAKDRVEASRMGAYATKLLIDGKANRVVCIKEDKLVDYDILEALNMKKDIDEDDITLAKMLAK